MSAAIASSNKSDAAYSTEEYMAPFLDFFEMLKEDLDEECTGQDA
jgi:hypothetical protein